MVIRAVQARPEPRRECEVPQAITGIVIPAFRAETLILGAVDSVLRQTSPAWEIWVVADDQQDYETILGRAGRADPRLRFLSTGMTGAGASRARNLALDAMGTRYVAILDADDRMKPEKLARAETMLAEAPIVATALDVMDDSFAHLRYVGRGPDRILTPGGYKFVSLSMDSMIVWDREATDARYDLEITNMTDLELLMRLWERADRIGWLGTPLHDYVKLTRSMSNGPGVTEKMIRSKEALLRRIEAGHYRFAAPDAGEGLAEFLRISLKAEALFPEAMGARPGLLFEDHLEPMLVRR